MRSEEKNLILGPHPTELYKGGRNSFGIGQSDGKGSGNRKDLSGVTRE